MTQPKSTRPAARAGCASGSFAIELPPNFRAADVLAFHRRDAQQVAERVDAQRLEKGLVWDGRAACLTIGFDGGRASAWLDIDGALALGPDDRVSFERMARRMLGLTQPVDAFERAFAAHAQIGPLIAGRPGLRVPLSATPFEALVWAVTGQQISIAAALSLRRRMITAAGPVHSRGLACHPDAAALAALDEPVLRAAGFSQSKARTVLGLAREAASGRLPLDLWSRQADDGRLPVDEVRARLSRLYGIGPWTIDYALLRGFGWLDGSLHGDAAVRRRLQQLLGAAARVDERQARRWLEAFSPWRALVAAHLWASEAVPPQP